MLADSVLLVNEIRVIKRDGSTVAFDAEKIRAALAKAHLKDHLGQFWVPGKTVLSQSERHMVDTVTELVCVAVSRPPNHVIHIEQIQDLVELELVRHGWHRVARGYVLYRAARNRLRIDESVHSGESIGAVLPADDTDTPRPSIEDDQVDFDLAGVKRPGDPGLEACDACQ